MTAATLHYRELNFVTKSPKSLEQKPRSELDCTTIRTPTEIMQKASVLVPDHYQQPDLRFRVVVMETAKDGLALRQRVREYLDNGQTDQAREIVAHSKSKLEQNFNNTDRHFTFIHNSLTVYVQGCDQLIGISAN